MIDIEIIVENSFYRDKFETNHKENSKFEVVSNKPLLPSLCLAKQYIPEDIESMIQFNIIHSSPPVKPESTIDH